MFGTAIYAIRHGPTDWNALGRFQGRTDVPLSQAGRAQALAAGRRLRSLFATVPAHLRPDAGTASPLARARETLDIVAGVLGLGACGTDERLREADFGRWEGLTSAEVKQQFPQERRARKADRWNFRPEGSEAGLADLEADMRSFLSHLKARPPHLVVTHTGNMRVMLHVLGGLAREEAAVARIAHEAVLVWDDGRLRWG